MCLVGQIVYYFRTLGLFHVGIASPINGPKAQHSNSQVVRCTTDALVFLLQVLTGSIISHFTSVQKCKNMLWLQNKLSPHFCMELIVQCVLYLCSSCYSSMVNTLWSVFIDVHIIWLLFRLCVGGSMVYSLQSVPKQACQCSVWLNLSQFPISRYSMTHVKFGLNCCWGQSADPSISRVACCMELSCAFLLGLCLFWCQIFQQRD